MSTSNKTSSPLISELRKDYPQFKFVAGTEEHWSPKTKIITYSTDQDGEHLCFGILHELSHALLGHSTYHSDFELLKLESEAWELASRIGLKYGISIDEDHIQNCLDTYRDWLHRRSSCPKCSTHVLQKDASYYQCFNCHTTWRVSSGRFVRPYRKTVKES
jgi:hypothetical protein